MILVSLLSGKLLIVTSSTNKWVYSLLCLHFLLIPFSFNSEFTLDQNYEYAKTVLVYLLMLAVADDEFSLQLLIKAFVFSMMFYMLHSLWEYHNGRHEYRQGIARMIGVDETHNDPNAFGASVVLSLPFVYVLLCSEAKSFMRKLYFSYFALAILCVILTGSRSASIAFVFLVLLWGGSQKGSKKKWLILLVLFSLGAVWTVMPVDKRERIRTIWDTDAGPKVASDSAKGRLFGWQVSWEMFKQKPFTGVGPGGKNFIGYRMAHNVDAVVGTVPSPHQSHNLYGQVLAEFGLPGALLFVGLIFATWKNSRRALRILGAYSREEGLFLCSLARAIMASLLLLLLLGLAGHNFYRTLWLWLAAWSGSLVCIAEVKIVCKPRAIPLSTQVH
ncbi:O-antigen ligase [Desulfobulbus sp.]|uniref:O-antigen ligase family protein n=1 Tax=Desulfobulbus sp. TaxID=895 RepID=UPI0027B88A25|nr:O-antigen ligase family protein [Desulfobulbus sp.]